MSDEEKQVNRREFLQKFGVFGALILAILAFGRNIILYLFPEKKKKSYHKYLVCKKNELKIGQSKQIKLGKVPVFIVKLPDEFKVFSGICTHLGCIIKWEQDKGHFYCPCHKGYFDKTGKVLAGPPPKPLEEYKVSEEGQLVYIYVEDKVRSPWA
ncbi:MAG: Rieske 2Fe-2S domain-containing protein [Calditrichia bacterium]